MTINSALSACVYCWYLGILWRHRPGLALLKVIRGSQPYLRYIEGPTADGQDIYRARNPSTGTGASKRFSSRAVSEFGGYDLGHWPEYRRHPICPKTLKLTHVPYFDFRSFMFDGEVNLSRQVERHQAQAQHCTKSTSKLEGTSHVINVSVRSSSSSSRSRSRSSANWLASYA